MKRVSQVQSFARWLHIATVAFMVLLPIVLVVYVAVTPVNAQTMQAYSHGYAISADATQTQLWIVILLNSLTTVVLFWTLNEMRKLFMNYRRGDILTDGSARFIQRVGFGFLGLAIVPILLHPITAVLLTWANSAGERQLSVALSSNSISFALAAGLLIIIGWAMRDASEAAAENKAFI